MSRILVVEDEEHLADGLCYNLEAEQYDVELVDNGEEALERLTGDPAPLRPGHPRHHAAGHRRVRGGDATAATRGDSSRS